MPIRVVCCCSGERSALHSDGLLVCPRRQRVPHAVLACTLAGSTAGGTVLVLSGCLRAFSASTSSHILLWLLLAESLLSLACMMRTLRHEGHHVYSQ